MTLRRVGQESVSFSATLLHLLNCIISWEVTAYPSSILFSDFGHCFLNPCWRRAICATLARSPDGDGRGEIQFYLGWEFTIMGIL